jgi:hypothetical protein
MSRDPSSLKGPGVGQYYDGTRGAFEIHMGLVASKGCEN